MVALLPVSNVIQFRFGGSYQNQPFLNVMHWEYSGGPPSATALKELCNDALGVWDTNFSAILHTDVRMNTVRGIDLSAPDAPQSASDVAAAVGDLVGTPLPVNVAMCISWLVNYRWRGGHIRTYLPAGATQSIQNGNSWSATALTNGRLAVTNFLAGMNAMTAGAVSGKLVGVRRWQTLEKGQPPVQISPPLVLPIVGSIVDSRLDSARRRLGRDVSA